MDATAAREWFTDAGVVTLLSPCDVPSLKRAASHGLGTLMAHHRPAVQGLGKDRSDVCILISWARCGLNRWRTRRLRGRMSATPRRHMG